MGNCLRPSLAVSALVVLLLLPCIAAANCPPGQRMVGVRNNGHIVYPICGPDHGDSGAVAPGQYAPAAMRWYALALHPDAIGAWIAKQHRSESNAEQAALAACGSAMGAGCTLNATIGNGWLAAVRDSYNNTWIGTGTRRRDATQMAMDYCKNRGGGHCEVIQTEGASATMEFLGVRDMMPASVDPPKGQFRKTWAAAAYIEGNHPDSPFNDAIWFAGGFPDKKSATETLLQQCHQESRLSCQIASAGAPSLIGAAYVQDGDDGAFSVFTEWGRSEKELRSAIQAECKKRRKPCSVVMVYESRRGDVQRIHAQHEAWKQSGGTMGRPQDAATP